MKVDVALFGAFREFEASARVTLDVGEGAQVAELRQALVTYAQSHWPANAQGLLRKSAFASSHSVMRDHEILQAGEAMAVLPPVSGG